MSGSQASSTEQAGYVAQAWEKYINAKGGINGHPVKIFVEDDQGDPTAAAAAAKKLVTQDHVISVSGATDNLITAWDSYVTGQGVPIVGGTGNSNDWFKNPLMFLTPTDVLSGLTLQVKVAKQYGHATKFADLYCAEVASCKDANPPLQAAAKAAGVGFTSLPVSSTAPDYTAECLSLKEQGVDYAQLNFTTAAAVKFVQSCQAQGYNPTWGTSMQSYAKGYLSLSNFTAYGPAYAFNPAMDTAFATAFNGAMDKYAGGKNVTGGPATWTWDALQLTAKVLANAPANPTSQDVINGLYALQGETLGGELANALTFTKDKAATPGAHPCGFVMGVQGGKLVAPAGADTICASASSSTG